MVEAVIAALIAIDVFETAVAGGALEGERLEGAGVDLLEFGGVIVEGARHFEVEDFLLVTLDAAQTPAGVDDVFDQVGLQGVGGQAEVEVSLAELVVLLVRFGGEHRTLGGDAVAEGVLGATRFAGVGGGALGFGSVDGGGLGTAVLFPGGGWGVGFWGGFVGVGVRVVVRVRLRFWLLGWFDGRLGGFGLGRVEAGRGEDRVQGFVAEMECVAHGDSRIAGCQGGFWRYC